MTPTMDRLSYYGRPDSCISIAVPADLVVDTETILTYTRTTLCSELFLLLRGRYRSIMSRF